MQKEVCSCPSIYKYVWPDDIKEFHSGGGTFSTVYPEGRSDCSASAPDCVTDSHCSGKTSLIHSLAGELGLDIYVVSLSSKG